MDNIFKLSDIEIQKLKNLLANSVVVESTILEPMNNTGCESACSGYCEGGCYGSCYGGCESSCAGGCEGSCSGNG